MTNAAESLLSRCCLGSHTTITLGDTTAFSSELAPGIYDLYSEGVGCYVRALNKTQKDASSASSSAHAYIPAGASRELIVPQPENGTSDHNYLGAISASAGVAGTLHITHTNEFV